jgi:hypothetical protein
MNALAKALAGRAQPSAIMLFNASGDASALRRDRPSTYPPTITISASAIAEVLTIDAKRISDEHLSLQSDFRNRKRGVETKLILADVTGLCDDTLFKNIALAHRYFDMIRSGKTYTEIAEAEGASKRRVQHLVELAFLAPDIVRDVWEGGQPVGLTSHWLKNHAFSPMWNAQRDMFKAL